MFMTRMLLVVKFTPPPYVAIDNSFAAHSEEAIYSDVFGEHVQPL